MPVVPNVNNGLHGAAQFGQGVFTKSRGFFTEFKEFLNKGNAFDLAVAFILSAALSAVIKSLVEDIITPLFGFASNRNLDEMFVILKCGKSGHGCSYPTRVLAQADGAVTWNWGRFINTIIYLLLVGFFLFCMVKLYYTLRRKVVVKDKACQYCTKDVAGGAVRCPFCTSWLDNDVRRKAEGEFIQPSSSLNNNNMSTTTLGTQNGLLREKDSIEILGARAAGMGAGYQQPLNGLNNGYMGGQPGVGLYCAQAGLGAQNVGTLGEEEHSHLASSVGSSAGIFAATASTKAP